MWDFYEQPWTLLGIAVISLFVVWTYRSVCDNKRHWWQFLIPILIATAGFGIDHFVQTDSENIEGILNAGIKAIEVENFSQIDSYLSDDYRDSLHPSKERLLEHAQSQLNTNIIEKCKMNAKPLITFSQNHTKAKANMFFRIIMGKDSPITQEYSIPLFNLSVDVYFIKRNENWLIENIEIRNVNNIQARWSDVR